MLTDVVKILVDMACLVGSQWVYTTLSHSDQPYLSGFLLGNTEKLLRLHGRTLSVSTNQSMDLVSV